MARIPTVNPNRFYDNKEIDIVSLLPSNMQGGEVSTFLQLFEDYLNTMYQGATKYIPPEELESIPYAKEAIWTNDYPYVTGPYGGFETYFRIGDWVSRNGESKYYKIEEILDDSTLKLTENYVADTPPAYYKSAFWDQFTTPDWVGFWYSSIGPSPIGMDSLSGIPSVYNIDPVGERITCNVSGVSRSTITTKMYGDYQVEFGFYRTNDGTKRNNKFGFQIQSEGTNPHNQNRYEVYHEDNILHINYDEENEFGYTNIVSAYMELDADDDTWTVNVVKNRDSNTIDFKISGIKKAVGSTPVLISAGVGFFNRFQYTMDVPSSEGFENMRLSLINGVSQGFDYVYFESDNGFPGEADGVGLTSEIRELPEINYVYPNQFGRTFQTDGEPDFIYQFYKYDGLLRIRDIETSIGLSATDFKKSINTISILEKIRRLTELHDPELIDMEFIDHFTRYLGYNVNIDRSTLGIFLREGEDNWDSLTSEEKQILEDKYLRFIVTNLPSWYKIKTTDNALVTMLYSFGLVAELSYYFCTDYGDESTWVNQMAITGSSSSITDEHFQTPHFSLMIDVDSSETTYLENVERISAIIDAILSVKPINTVFRSLGAFFKRNIPVYVSMIMRSNLYTYIPFD